MKSAAELGDQLNVLRVQAQQAETAWRQHQARMDAVDEQIREKLKELQSEFNVSDLEQAEALLNQMSIEMTEQLQAVAANLGGNP